MLEERSFVLEKPFLAPKFAGVSHKRSSRSDNAMTGEKNWNGVSVVGPADRSRRLWVAHALGDLAIGGAAAERDFPKLVPNALLKPGAERG